MLDTEAFGDVSVFLRESTSTPPSTGIHQPADNIVDVQEWRKMVKAGLAGEGDMGSEDMQAACLEAWANTMQQDLVLAQALLSHPLGPSDDLTASLRNVLDDDRNGNSYLTRYKSMPLLCMLQRACLVFTAKVELVPTIINSGQC